MLNILKDDLSEFAGRGPAFVAFGETMVRDTPADLQRLEMARQVHISLAGSEYTLAMILARLGIPSGYITRVPDNPYGWLIRDTARGQGVNTDYFAWAPRGEPVGRFLYEIGRTPRKSVGWYQRMYSAASRLAPGMVDWGNALAGCRLFHTSGITFGLAAHSKYERNYLLEAFEEAVAAMPDGCRVGLDLNYRATLWSAEQCRAVLTPLIRQHVSIVVTTIEDMAVLYGLGCGPYSAEQIDRGDLGPVSDADLQAFAEQVRALFDAEIVALTLRYPDSFEANRWESAALDAAGHFVRSAAVRDIVLLDRLGGGDTWNGGFYYGLLTAGFGAEGLEKGVLVGDAATRLKQTLMFDLPVVTKAEVQDLLRADATGGGRRVAR
ncbi:MAG: 2-dehydro-3-deoxygluconokinase [Chloroflexi bacterium ADurb.Bin325]|nr:MAG: 2-dehydro-3-deoxygluconokinase [Chloroflexi bacterium ADurb.Bin325]